LVSNKQSGILALNLIGFAHGQVVDGSNLEAATALTRLISDALRNNLSEFGQ
jgi:hypothetical protein